jgi:hypothetical protein
MATERQIEANRRNSAKSTGPSEAGKARSRLNATKHGLAAGSIEVEDSPEFLERRAKWAAEQRPVGEAGHWALDRAVSSTFRIERCERALEEVITTSRERAMHSWPEDRAAEAASIASGLARDPVLASRRLRASLAGVELLIEAWLGLIAALGTGRDWTEAERSRALDLLGSAPDLRSGRTVVDPGVGERPITFRLELAFGELERLEASRDESMAPLDEWDRRRAARGDAAILSKPAKLVLRYEREAWRHYREAMAQLREPGSAPAPPKVVAPAPAVDHPSPVAEVVANRVVAEEDSAPRGGVESGRALATERSQFGVGPVEVTDRTQFREVPADRVLMDLVGAPG